MLEPPRLRGPADERRDAYQQRYGLTATQRKRLLRIERMNQLDACMSEEARRLLLGKGEQ